MLGETVFHSVLDSSKTMGFLYLQSVPPKSPVPGNTGDTGGLYPSRWGSGERTAREFKKTERGKTTNARTMNFGGKNPCSFDPIFTMHVWLLENGVETGGEAAPDYSPGTHTLSYCPRRGGWFYPSTQTVIDEGQFLESGSNPTGHNFAFHIIEWHMFYLFDKIKSYLTFWGRFYYLIQHFTCHGLKKYAVKYVLFDKMRFRCSLSVKFLPVIIFLKEWIHYFGKRGIRSRKRWKFVLLFGLFALVCIPFADILIGTLSTKGKYFEI